MFSKNKRFLMIYNGEVYNFNEIKENLLKKGIKFKGSSDTEVILESISVLGFSQTISILEGMFSLGVYDLENDRIYLARDRVGIKPLYWSKNQELFIFGSDLKAFKKSKQLNLSINHSLINSFLKYGYIPSPYTIYENIFKLEPGNILEYDSNGNIKIYNYIPNFHDEKKTYNYFEKKNKLKNILRKSVKTSMVSDVKIGSMLSSGIDSSLITSLMQENNIDKVNTYTVGFDFISYDESKYAKQISNILGTNHNELILTENNIKKDFFNALDSYDEPFADSSQLPTFLISKNIKKNISVALSGDGGDEIFVGYNRYIWATKFHKFNKYSPTFLKNIIFNNKIFIKSKFRKYNKIITTK